MNTATIAAKQARLATIRQRAIAEQGRALVELERIERQVSVRTRRPSWTLIAMMLVALVLPLLIG